MKIEIKEVQIKINLVAGKHENLLANASLIFKGETGDYFTISGFSIWKSKFEGFNVEVPRKLGFKYCLFESSLWKRITKEILNAYDYASIPIVEKKKRLL